MYAIKNIDEGMELLTGVKAGKIEKVKSDISEVSCLYFLSHPLSFSLTHSALEEVEEYECGSCALYLTY